MKSHFRSEPVVSESPVRAALVSLRKERSRIPAQLNVAKQPKLQQAAHGSLVDVLFGPLPIPAIFQLQHAILRDMGWIADGWPVGVCGNRIGVAAGLFSQPLPSSRFG